MQRPWAPDCSEPGVRPSVRKAVSRAETWQLSGCWLRSELIESDLWVQYSELGGVQDNEVSGVNGGNAPYVTALQLLDGDMSQYIHDNADDENSHAAFLNAYLVSKGYEAVNLDQFRTLPSSTATGARQDIQRLTNLTQLSVDTSWWVRVRSTTNPDFGATFPDAVPSLHVGQHTAIPRSDDDTAGSDSNNTSDHLKAIAFTAGFHFGFIEQGGTSLYPTLAQKVRSQEVLRILLSIGGSEIMHFQTWQDKAGNATPLTDVDPVTGATVTFTDLTTNQPETLQANLIFPEPTEFLIPGLPASQSFVRPAQNRSMPGGPSKASLTTGFSSVSRTNSLSCFSIWQQRPIRPNVNGNGCRAHQSGPKPHGRRF